ncbi:amino acid adenylation domain-containing protein [Pseudomonas solani]|uniref:amino acid adenylation domain-containing protein n=1 Tax=Pseudomonas solani TaxID=2731552 RepID=UPI003F4AAD2C
MLKQGAARDIRAEELIERLRGLDAGKRRQFFAKLRQMGIDVARLPIVPACERGRHGLSYAQQRQWFLWKLDPHSAAYHIPVVLRLQGAVDTGALEQAFHGLIDRHESLRTRFVEEDGEVHQQIEEALDFTLDVTRLQAGAGQEHVLNDYLEARILEPFDLEKGPLIRAALACTGEAEQVLVVVLHHSITDGWSMGVMVDDLLALYKAAVEHTAAQLEPLPIQFRDYAAWQRQWLEAGERERQLGWWKERLGEGRALLELPTDHARPPVQSHRGARFDIPLPARLAAALKALARSQDTTLFSLLLASFQVLLHRYSGQAEVRVGVPMANRNRRESERLIGLFINTQVFQGVMHGHTRFSELLQQLQQMGLEAQAYQDLPFEQLVEALQPERSLSHNPLFQVMYNHQAKGGALAGLPGLTVESLTWDSGTAQLDLTLETCDEGDGLSATLVYATDLFEAATIARMAGHWLGLLEAILAQPDAPIAALPMLSIEEREAQLQGWNATATDYPLTTPVHHLIEAQVLRNPDAPALAFGAEQLSYAELNRRANRLAHTLIAQGVGPDSLVGIAVERSIEMVMGLLAILKAGGAYVPLDPEYPAERLAYMLDDSAVKLLLSQSHLDLPLAEGVQRIDLDQALLGDFPDHNPGVVLDAENLVYVIYTSGSTGKPKGAGNRHSALTNRLCWMQQAYGLDASDSVLQKTPFSFDVSVWEFFWPLMTGARLVVAAPGDHRDPAKLVSLIEQENITTLHFVPSMLQAFLLDPQVERCSSLKRIVCSGEALPVDAQQQVFARLPQAGLYNLYGPTEAAIDVTHWTCRDEGKDGVPIGQPIANLGCYILDANLEPVPVGVLGELYLAGEGLARGYHRRPALTAERFVANPFVVGERMYRTGDLARYRESGVIEYAGRIDHQVKIRGLRIELGEIEARLMELAEVREAVVLAVDQRLVGYVVPAQGDLDTESLASQLRQGLPDYMVPAQWVLLESMPLSPNGKLERKALPQPEAGQSSKAYVAPATATQQHLAAIWQEILGVAQVGAQDNFFELGGDSIVSIQVVSRARQKGILISPKDLFQHQTIEALAAVARHDNGPATVEQGPLTGSTPLLPAQRMFFDAQWPDAHHWNQSVLLHPAQPLQADVLEQALGALVQRHDALRLRFTQVSGVWQAHFAAPAGEPVLAQRQLAEPAQLAALCDEVQGSLDLEHGPLLRVVLIDMGDASQRLLVVIHHLAVDGVSWRVLFDDLQQAYAQAARGEAPVFAPKGTSVKAWAERLQAHATRGGAEAEFEFWQAYLGDAQPGLPQQREGRATYRQAAHANAHLDKDTTRRLLQEAPAAYRTRINDLLLTALARVLCRWTGNLSALVQLEGHGREDLGDGLDVSQTLGWFTSFFPVHLHPQGSLGDSIKRIKEDLRSVPDGGVGFTALRYLGAGEVPARMAALPAPSVTFNYLGQLDGSFAAEGGLFMPAKEPAGREQSLEAPLPNGLVLNGQVYDGQLAIDWCYSHECFDAATVQALADDFAHELRALVEHCCASGEQGVTPSDFPLMPLTQQQLDALPGPVAQLQDIYPLSPMQQGMLFHSLYQESRAEYVNQLRVDAEGLEPQRFRDAWQHAMDRHDVLRSAFLWQSDMEKPLQIVQRRVNMPFEVLDWRSQADSAQALDALADDERNRGFELGSAPLLRIKLVQLAEGRCHLVLTHHHILVDGWSLSLLLGEVLQHYAGQPLPGRAGRYADYIGWLQQRDAQASEQFWRPLLSTLEEPTRLARANPMPLAASGYGDHRVQFDPARSHGLQEAARHAKVTLNTLVQAAWLLLLQRYTGQTTVAFGATVAGRPAELPGIEEQVGLFINTLPVIAAPAPQQSVTHWLEQVQALNLELRDHEHTPLYEIQRWAGQGGESLFDTLMVFENYPMSAALQQGAPQGLRFGEVANHERTNYPLTLSVSLEDGLVLEFSYDKAYFTEAVVQRLAGHLSSLIGLMAAQPQAALGSLDYLDAGERQQLVGQWSSATLDYPSERFVHQLFEDQAGTTPTAAALLFESRQLSYAELNARANRLARHLMALGVGPDVRVGLAVERGLDLVIGLLAVLKAGGAYVPLDPGYPSDRLLCMIEDSGAALVLTQQPLLDTLPIPAGLPRLCLDRDDAWQGLDSSDPQVHLHPHNLAYVMFTSGSTGRPKGVGISHQALARHAWVALDFFDLGAEDRVLQFSTFNFDGFVEQLYPALICGAAVVLRGSEIWDSETFYRELLDKRISVVDLTTAYWSMIARDFAEIGPRSYGALRQVHSGGEAMPPEGLSAWRQAGLGAIRLLNTYGPTEATVTATTLDCAPYVSEARPLPLTLPIGRVLPGRSIYLLDEVGLPAPVGMIGELVIGGELLARGYFNRPGLTAERFIPDPFASEPGARLYRTGDLARYNAEGEIEYVGRVDHQVKIRGFRIELGEIEARLLEQDSVRDAVVLALPGANGLQIVGYVVPQEPGLLAADGDEQGRWRAAVGERLKAQLPDYMVPGCLVLLEGFPLSPNGKLDRKALPAPDAASQQQRFEAPADELEARLADVWQDVLGLERVGRGDHFFELGGHSLLATQVVARLRRCIEQPVSLRDLFEAPVLSALGERLRSRATQPEAARASAQSLVTRRTGAATLSLAQRRLWVIEQFSASGAYGMPMALRLGGELQAPLLAQALNEVIRRHEILRTAYVADDEGDPLALVSEHLAIELPLLDLSTLPRDERDARVAAAVEDNAQSPISLLRAPLLRARLLRLDAEEHVLLFAMHHIISDGWSLSILAGEVMEIYSRLRENDLAPLPELPLQYADFAAWQQDLERSGALQAQADFWAANLAGSSGLLALPSDRPRPANASLAGCEVSFVIEPALGRGLHELARSQGTTLYNVLLAAFQVMLHRIGASDDIVIGVDVAGRGQVELEALIGFFVNVLPVRSRYAAAQPFSAFLADTRQAALNAFEHQDLPFDMIVEAAAAPRHKGANPLVQVLFVMSDLPLQRRAVAGLRIEPIESATAYSKFDMALFVEAAEDGLQGTWQFASELFDVQRINALLSGWIGILKQIVGDPNIRSEDIDMPIHTAASAEVPVRNKADKLGKFLKKAQGGTPAKAQGPIRETLVVPGQDFPLMMEPSDPGIDLVDWAKANRPLLEAKLARHASILFRGFALRDIHDFEAFAEAVQPGLYGQYGDLPKKEGGKNTYRSTPYPEQKMILFHNEGSHQDRWPRKQLFFCELPSPIGGATPIVDCRQMYRQMPEALRDQFERKGLLYVRTFSSDLDVPWQHFFKTEMRAEVEARCSVAGIQWLWLENDGLQIRTPCPAIIRHPVTGEKSFFNQVQLHHIHCLDADVRDDLLAMFGLERMPRHVYFGDGSPISDAIMQQVGELYEACAVRPGWQKGDVLLLDNMLAAHARDPFEGARKIVVAMSEMFDRRELEQPSGAQANTETNEVEA